MKSSDHPVSETPSPCQKKIFTIPNLLSFFRLLLIPVFIWLYCVKKDYPMTTLVLILSGLTDLVDGYVARHFNMVSDLGKMLDPVADKLTQIAMLFCLVTAFPLMLIPLILLIVKEIAAAIAGILIIRKTGKVHGAVWHGKVNTALLYAVMIIHVFWFNIPAVLSNILIALCVAMMALSFVLYLTQHIKLLRHPQKEN